MSVQAADFGRLPATRAYADPLLTEIAMLRAQQRVITTRLRELRRQAEIGRCEVCGAEFRRTRSTKKVCSQKCSARAYVNRSNGVVDIPAIEEALPMLRAGRLLSARSLDIVERVVDSKTAMHVGEEVHLSHQRVSQIIAQASRLARIALQMKQALLKESAAQS